MAVWVYDWLIDLCDWIASYHLDVLMCLMGFCVFDTWLFANFDGRIQYGDVSVIEFNVFMYNIRYIKKHSKTRNSGWRGRMTIGELNRFLQFQPYLWTIWIHIYADISTHHWKAGQFSLLSTVNLFTIFYSIQANYSTCCKTKVFLIITKQK